jgi:hypothetical protein
MGIRLTEDEARELLGDRYQPPKKSKSKYHSSRTEIDGIWFASKHEAQYYAELKIRQRAAEIDRFELQPEFVLQEGYTTTKGKRVLPIIYRADFRVFYPDGRQEIVDTKGYRTREYKNKIKMLLKMHPDIWFTEA